MSYNDVAHSSTISIIDSSLEDVKSRRWLSFPKPHRLALSASSGDGDVSTFDCDRDLTPGSLEVWQDLPDSIKYDPALAPFKQLYEQRYGEPLSPEIVSPEENGNLVIKKADTVLAFEKNDNKENRKSSKKEKLSSRRKQIEKLLRFAKLTLLVAGWVVLTVALLLNREKTDVLLHTAVSGGEVKEYELNTSKEAFSTLITLTGPFGGHNTSKQLTIWLRRSYENGDALESLKWKINLQPDNVIDFSPSASESKILTLENRGRNRKENSTEDEDFRNGTVTLRMSTNGNKTVPLTLTYQLDPLSEEDGIIYAAFLLLTLYVLIIFEIVNRTIAALLSSSLGIAVLAINGTRPTLPELISWLDSETLLLLFSMMILVAILAETGLFDYLAVVAFEVTGGRTWPLINCLCFFTAFFSTFLDNVTTVLLMTPVTIRLCEVMQLNPVPVLMSMVIFSNVGGAATPVGDPPNVIIASHPSILNANINFTNFTLHMGLGILFVSVQTYFQLRFIFRDINSLRHAVPRQIVELRQELAVWKRASASLSPYSRDEDIVKRALEKKVQRLNALLLKKESGSGTNKNDPLFCSTLAQMKEKYCIRDKPLLIKASICVTFVVVVFFLHAIPQLQNLSLGWTALLGAILLLLLAEREDLEPILARVEWSTLLFFAALFVLMEVLSKLGLIAWIGRLTENLILQVGEESRLAVAIMLILWVSGLASAFVDNIPLSTMMVRVTAALSDPTGLALPLQPLAWALSFGACLGGNGTLIGASANVVCAGVAEQHGYRFTFMQYLKIGFPIMIGNLIVASIYLLFCHVLFTWH
ncbi:P protein-like isoform X1 [Pieris brassicae]|uniref:P protein-like isoform X1 n=1 Tax=Pieris brassicae TaxID=7116 RepID=UPI001E6615F2|nr:P protein-like isoform X1 [Pieris brassicae]